MNEQEYYAQFSGEDRTPNEFIVLSGVSLENFRSRLATYTQEHPHEEGAANLVQFLKNTGCITKWGFVRENCE